MNNSRLWLTFDWKSIPYFLDTPSAMPLGTPP